MNIQERPAACLLEEEGKFLVPGPLFTGESQISPLQPLTAAPTEEWSSWKLATKLDLTDQTVNLKLEPGKLILAGVMVGKGALEKELT